MYAWIEFVIWCNGVSVVLHTWRRVKHIDGFFLDCGPLSIRLISGRVIAGENVASFVMVKIMVRVIYRWCLDSQ